MLEHILMTTVLCSACEEQRTAYQDWLDYRVVAEGYIAENLANSWKDPALSGSPYFIMQPASGEEVYLRFVQSPRSPEYTPMSRVGWNAAEMLVEDPDTLAAHLADSPHFRILQPPDYLTEKRNIRAFQAAGPANEVLYFTRIIDPNLTTLNFGKARVPVDLVFISVLGTSDIERSRRFYGEVFQLNSSEPIPYRVGVISEAYDLPLDTLHSLSLMPLTDRFMIELDQLPSGAKSLQKNRGLPAGGVAMVTFTASELPADVRPELGSVRVDEFPYHGRSTATFEGPDGELIEVVVSL